LIRKHGLLPEDFFNMTKKGLLSADLLEQRLFVGLDDGH